MCFCDMFGVFETGAKMELPEGGGHAIRPCRRMFRKGRPLLPWLHFGLHFGVILGARGATILIWGSQWCRFGGQKWRSTFGIPWRTPCRGGEGGVQVGGAG